MKKHSHRGIEAILVDDIKLEKPRPAASLLWNLLFIYIPKWKNEISVLKFEISSFLRLSQQNTKKKYNNPGYPTRIFQTSESFEITEPDTYIHLHPLYLLITFSEESDTKVRNPSNFNLDNYITHILPPLIYLILNIPGDPTHNVTVVVFSIGHKEKKRVWA